MYFKEDDTNVCSRIHLVNLGEYVPDAYDTMDLQGEEEQDDFETFKSNLKELCKEWDSSQTVAWKHWNGKHVPKMAFIEATTCSGQPIAEEYLERLGFESIGPFKKLKHKVTTVTIWVISAAILCENIGYVSKADPRTEEERKAWVQEIRDHLKGN